MRLGVWLGANRSDTEVSRGFATTPQAQRRGFKRRIACNTAPKVRWPNLLRVDTIVKPALSVQWQVVSDLELDPAKTVITAELAPAVGGATDLSKTTNIDLSKLPKEFREQRIVFQAARKAFDQLSGKFTGNREYLVFQLIRLVEEFLGSKKLVIPSLFHAEGGCG